MPPEANVASCFGHVLPCMYCPFSFFFIYRSLPLLRVLTLPPLFRPFTCLAMIRDFGGQSRPKQKGLSLRVNITRFPPPHLLSGGVSALLEGNRYIDRSTLPGIPVGSNHFWRELPPTPLILGCVCFHPGVRCPHLSVSNFVLHVQVVAFVVYSSIRLHSDNWNSDLNFALDNSFFNI